LVEGRQSPPSEPAKLAASVELGNLAEAVYDGSPQWPTVITVPPVLSLTWAGAPQTNAGSYMVTAMVNDSNYVGKATGTFTIAKATSTVTVNCPASVIYSGSAQMPCTAKASGVGLSDDVTLTVSYSNNANLGIAEASASWDGMPTTRATSDPVALK